MSAKQKDNSLFDLDFLENDADKGETNASPSSNREFPMETLDLDDISIENDYGDPFADRNTYPQTGSSQVGDEPLHKAQKNGFFKRLFGKKTAVTASDNAYEMHTYSNIGSAANDSFLNSTKQYDIKALFEKYLLGRGDGENISLEPRTILINDAHSNSHFKDNHVSTTKYNFATFLPKFLFQEFSKYANLFFLFTAIIQQVPDVTPTNRYTTIGTLTVVLFISAIKECVEDIKRANSDKELNYSPVEVFDPMLKGFTLKKWIDIKVGDIIKLTSEEAVPSDIVLISSSEPEGLCYVETANLDGETNLKIKQARPETSKFFDVQQLAQMSGQLVSEAPNSSLYTYEATMTLNGKSFPMSPEQLVLRGATVRNTSWVYGFVVNTGHETKLMRNATATPIKRTKVERIINVQIIMLFGLLILFSFISSLGNIIQMTAQSKNLEYLYLDRVNKVGLFFKNILTFWILYSNLVPISMFVTLEMIKYYQAWMISSDLELYSEETDTPTIVRTSSLVEELGQIKYIFSDKTGTLTRNVMEFKSCSIAGKCYIEKVPQDKKATMEDGVEVGYRSFEDMFKKLADTFDDDSAVINQFLTLLSICHTVIPEFRDDGTIKYQASSPDEGALVEGAAKLGYKFLIRKPTSVRILVESSGEELEYKLLNVCEFNSTRKRMSAIFRFPDGSIKILCKGADTVILERLGEDGMEHVEATTRQLEEYASEGLRTLCIAYRDISEEEYQMWNTAYQEAATTLDNRGEKMDAQAEIIEQNLILLGATAIEDKLQEGVPETIQTLQEAGIKIWVLTGDKQETAINIGMSCRLLSEDMNLLIVNEETKEETRKNFIEKFQAFKEHNISSSDLENLALVIDGKSLSFALEPDLEDYLMQLGKMCKAVICCRVSPLQKALVVKMAKRKTKDILLAIGDGANDVSMIQAAHVGIGISGMEGMQAARSADFAIAQFHYLKRLLLVHGSWSYQRISQAILYSFYKNIALYMTQFWYVFANVFSGQSIMESWIMTYYNVFFTVLPPFVLGVFDQFVSSRLLERYPQLYTLGQKGQFFNVTIFWGWIINGFYHSAITFICSILFYKYGNSLNMHGETVDHWTWGVAVYTSSIITVLGKAALITNQWTKFTFFAIPGSLLFWLVFYPIYAAILPHWDISYELRGTISHCYRSATFWLMCIVVPMFSLLRDILWKYYKRNYNPATYHIVQEMQKYKITDNRPRVEQFQKAIRRVRQVQRMKKQRGFAFSQSEEGGQEKIMRMYDTTQKRGEHGELLDASANPFRDM